MTVSRAGRRRESRLEQRATPALRWVVPALIGVFLLSGSAGLVHEVVWARLFGRLFGATSLAVSTVLAAYMGGLAIGSYWIGRRLQGIGDRRRAYALFEIGIGVSALLVPLLLHLLEPVYGVLWRRFQFSFAAFTVLRFLLAVGLLSVPTVLMGATLPVLADYFAALGDRRVAPQWLYTANLAGAVLGVGAAGFVVMPGIGLLGTVVVGVAINLLVGLAVLAMPQLPERRPAPTTDAPAVRQRPPVILLVAAGASGFASLATQVVWTRVLVLIVGSSTYAFSAVLLVYLFALAAGSMWASRRGTRVVDVLPDLAVVHVLLGVFTLGAVRAVDRLPYWYASLLAWWAPAGIAGTVALDVGVLFALLLLPVLSAGTVLPLALAGALLAGFVLLPTVGSQHTLAGAAVLAGFLALVFALASAHRRTLGPAVAIVVVLLLAGAVLERPWGQEALNAAVYDPIRASAEIVHPLEHVVFHREGRNATVAVIERKSVHALRINGRINASDHPLDMMTQILLAQVPLLLAPHTDDVFLVGWGSGITAGTVLQAPVKHLTAVEIEPAVVEASELFRPANHGARSDPRSASTRTTHAIFSGPRTSATTSSFPSRHTRGSRGSPTCSPGTSSPSRQAACTRTGSSRSGCRATRSPCRRSIRSYSRSRPSFRTCWCTRRPTGPTGSWSARASRSGSISRTWTAAGRTRGCRPRARASVSPAPSISWPASSSGPRASRSSRSRVS